MRLGSSVKYLGFLGEKNEKLLILLNVENEIWDGFSLTKDFSLEKKSHQMHKTFSRLCTPKPKLLPNIFIKKKIIQNGSYWSSCYRLVFFFLLLQLFRASCRQLSTLYKWTWFDNVSKTVWWRSKNIKNKKMSFSGTHLYIGDETVTLRSEMRPWQLHLDTREVNLVVFRLNVDLQKHTLNIFN